MEKEKKPYTHSLFLLFALGLLPGVAHMYLGMVRRGLFFLSALAFAIFVTTQLAILGAIPFVILPAFGIAAVVFIAFFESLGFRRDLANDKEVNDTIPEFVKKPWVIITILALLIIPFALNILFMLPWYSWVILAIIFLVAIMYFSKKSPRV